MSNAGVYPCSVQSVMRELYNRHDYRLNNQLQHHLHHYHWTVKSLKNCIACLEIRQYQYDIHDQQLAWKKFTNKFPHRK